MSDGLSGNELFLWEVYLFFAQHSWRGALTFVSSLCSLLVDTPEFLCYSMLGLQSLRIAYVLTAGIPFASWATKTLSTSTFMILAHFAVLMPSPLGMLYTVQGSSFGFRGFSTCWISPNQYIRGKSASAIVGIQT